MASPAAARATSVIGTDSAAGASIGDCSASASKLHPYTSLDGSEDPEGWNVSGGYRRGRWECPPTTASRRSADRPQSADGACPSGHCPTPRHNRSPARGGVGLPP